jgi:uncharacterized surface protein with fasciclin (FAS1) repeats
MEILQERQDLSKLVTAVERANMDELLGQPGSFTLFAPSDAAFDLLPTGLSDSLFTDDDFLPHLVDLLLYHIIADEYKRLDFSDFLKLTTENTEIVTIKRVPLRVNDIGFTDVNINAANGVAHVIAQVLKPSWVTSNLRDRVYSDSELSSLFTLVTMAGVDLESAGPFTLLAPTNAAFADLPQLTLSALMTNTKLMNIVLEAHVFIGVWSAAELIAGSGNGIIKTVAGRAVTVEATAIIEFENADFSGILANNGIMFKITELLPFQIM